MNAKHIKSQTLRDLTNAENAEDFFLRVSKMLLSAHRRDRFLAVS